MSLAEAMAAVTAPPPKTKMERYLEAMDAEDRRLVESWLDDRVGYTNHQIAQALTKAGYPIGRTAVADYRERRRSQ